MLELEFGWSKFHRLGVGVVLKKWLPLTAVMTALTVFGVIKLSSDVSLSVVLFVVAALGLWKFYKLSVRVLSYLTIKSFLKVTVGKDDVKGFGSFKKPIYFKKNEVHNIIFIEREDVSTVTFTLNRPRFKFVGKVRFLVYDFYLTQESFKELKKLISYRWGGSIRTTEVNGKDVLAWRKDH